MNPPATTIQFKKSPAQFLMEWKAERALSATGKVIAYLVIACSIVALIIHIVFASAQSTIPIISLDDGHPLSRLVWLLLLCDLGALYVLSEVKRRQEYTSKNDVYSYMDYQTRVLLAQNLTSSWSRNQQLTSRSLLQEILKTSSMTMLLLRLEVNPSSVYESIDQLGDTNPVALTEHVPQIDEQLQEWLIVSAERALGRGDERFGVADIFLTFLSEDEAVNKFFQTIDLTPEKFATVLGWLSTKDHLSQEYNQLHQQYMHTGSRNKAWTSVPTPMLDHYGQDMSVLASYGGIPLISVREPAVDEAVRILSRGNKNSLIIVGEPGVGKSTIVERIALRMAEENVPEPLKDKRLVHIDVSALHGDQKGFSSAFEEVISEAERSGNVIIYISDLQDLVTESSAGLPVVELLLPILERSRMQIIGATTMRQYHEQIEQSASITSAFGVLQVPEVGEAEAVTILEETAIQLEYRNHVAISLKAIEAAVHLSAQYIHDRVLPEKAIDILDEASVMVSTDKRQMVTENDIRTVIAQRTNIPVTTVNQSEQSTLLNMEKLLHNRVIGQDEAVKAISAALRRSRAGLSDTHRPIGTFLFVGPTGVGKTELAKGLAEIYFHSEEAMIRLDMSEYQDTESTVRLIGQKGVDGLLTGPVRAKPFTLILLDEFEKAATDIRNLFLQVFDDGRITDGQGRVVDFQNSIIIATSNAGSLEIQDAVKSGQSYEQIKDQLVSNILPKIYSPELLNRFDGVIVFRPLDQSEVVQIARLQIGKVIAQVKQSSGIDIVVTDAAVQKLAHDGFDPSYGGRPLRRVIQDKLESPLANMILAKGVSRGQQLVIDQSDLAQ